MMLAGVRPCSSQKPLNEILGRRSWEAVLASSPARCSSLSTWRGSGAAAQARGPRGVGALEALVDGDLRGVKEIDLVGELDFALGIDVKQTGETEQRGVERSARDDH